MNKQNLAFDTLNAIDLFDGGDHTKDMLIMHIPHSGIIIPNITGYQLSNEELNGEMNLLTDHHTDIIFNIADVTQIVPTFSRIFCDVERLPDMYEPQFINGRGYFYTHTDNGKLLRNDIFGIKDIVYHDYYLTHHNMLKFYVDEKLIGFGKVLIIDCHSFSNIPLNTDLDKHSIRPDICIGVDEFHTPKELIDFTVNYFESLGYSVLINSPHSGTIIPLDYLNKDKNVMGIMIEINKDLYMREDYSDKMSEVIKLNAQLSKFICNLSLE